NGVIKILGNEVDFETSEHSYKLTWINDNGGNKDHCEITLMRTGQSLRGQYKIVTKSDNQYILE
ncbi:hypothetical protein KIV40_29300, partial [Vibrio sp. D173a]|uniref:hypothetical protein n=1 Tax=Vibrio sp. D173a TaxID=2836349 RepID=UPI002553DE51